MVRWGRLILGAGVWLLVAASPAGAVIPAGNLLVGRNPGTEEGSASSTGNDVFAPPRWTASNDAQRATAVRYGAPGFLTAAQGAALGGGRSFFAGGPPGGSASESFDGSLLSQRVSLPAEANGDIDAGGVQVTVGGCLGGNGNQDDYARLGAAAVSPGAQPGVTAPFFAEGPRAAERGMTTS